jgi:hypothetical protein
MGMRRPGFETSSAPRDALIDDFDNFDLTSIEPKAHPHFEPEMVGALPNLHPWLSFSSWSMTS